MSEDIRLGIRQEIVCLRATINEIQASVRDIEQQTNTIFYSTNTYSPGAKHTLLSTYLERLRDLKCKLSDINVKHDHCTKCIKF